MNSVEIEGNLARDPIIRATKTGRAVASFTVATSRRYVTPQGEPKEQTSYINVVAWGTLAETVGNCLKKGYRCKVSGYYNTRSYDDQNGQRHWISEVVAEGIWQPLTPKEVSTNPPTYGDQWNQQKQATHPNNPPQSNSGFNQFGPTTNQGSPFPEDGPSEEIPF